jgi:hypothetical protein
LQLETQCYKNRDSELLKKFIDNVNKVEHFLIWRFKNWVIEIAVEIVTKNEVLSTINTAYYEWVFKKDFVTIVWVYLQFFRYS